MLQRFAAYCSVLQRVAACCSVCSALVFNFTVLGTVLQRVAVEMQCVAVCAVCCTVLKCSCSESQCVAAPLLIVSRYSAACCGAMQSKTVLTYKLCCNVCCGVLRLAPIQKKDYQIG